MPVLMHLCVRLESVGKGGTEEMGPAGRAATPLALSPPRPGCFYLPLSALTVSGHTGLIPCAGRHGRQPVPKTAGRMVWVAAATSSRCPGPDLEHVMFGPFSLPRLSKDQD